LSVWRGFVIDKALIQGTGFRGIMVAEVKTVAFQGMDVRDIDVQVQIASGLPAFTIVGLPDKAVAESKERVRAALHALGLSLPAKRMTVNLAPADVAKEGSHYDLPIALGLLAAMEIIPKEDLHSFAALGELSLDGRLRGVSGVLPAAMHVGGQDLGLICPQMSAQEARWAGEIEIIAAETLLQFINHFKGTQLIADFQSDERIVDANEDENARHRSGLTDMAQIKGQENAKRALEIAAAGGHNLLMVGPPGSGKSMMAAALPGILPDLTPRESLEVSMVHSLVGTLPAGGIMRTRPYRDPHHSASQPALVGGGQKVRPGEISLAHHGVLFLDELPEFQRPVLEALRQPLETGQTLVARANAHATFPAEFQLIAAMNPCRCGYMGDAERECARVPRCGQDYQSKISGPFLDRIDIRIDVPAVSLADITSARKAESSHDIRQRVIAARTMQSGRTHLCQGDAPLNSRLKTEHIETICLLDAPTQKMISQFAEKTKMSARGYYRVLRVARTIDDLAGNKSFTLSKQAVAEAVNFRTSYGS
jgi:magnesium chelatase family protein